MKLYLVQFHPELNRKEANLFRILDYVDKGLAAGANLICFGEMALVGYELTGKVDYKAMAEPIPGPATEEVAAKIKGKNCLVCFGMAQFDLGDVYNAAPLIGPDGIIGVAQKLYLANFESIRTGITYMEGVHFKPGKRISIFDTPFGKIGVEVCLDNYHPEIAHAQAIAGCWLILQPSGTPLIIDAKALTPPPLTLGRGFENNACFCYVDIVGDQGGISYNGATSVIQGVAGCKVLASYGKDAKEEVVEFEIDPNDIYSARARFPMLRDVRPDLMKQLWEITTQARYE